MTHLEKLSFCSRGNLYELNAKSIRYNNTGKPKAIKIDYFHTLLLFVVYIIFFFFNWDSLHAILNSHYKAWSYKKKKHKNIKDKSVQKEPTIKRCLLILYLRPFRLQVKGKHSIDREFQSVAVRRKKLLTQTSL